MTEAKTDALQIWRTFPVGSGMVQHKFLYRVAEPSCASQLLAAMIGSDEPVEAIEEWTRCATTIEGRDENNGGLLYSGFTDWVLVKRREP